MWWGSAGALHVHDADTCSTRDVISLHWCSYCTWEQLLNEVYDVRLDIQGHVSTQDSEDISAMVSDWKVFFLCVSKGSLLTDLSLISPLQCFKSTRNYLPRIALGQELWISSKPCLFSQHFPVLILSSSLEPKNLCLSRSPGCLAKPRSLQDLFREREFKQWPQKESCFESFNLSFIKQQCSITLNV